MEDRSTLVPNKIHAALVYPVSQVASESGVLGNPSKPAGALPVAGFFSPMQASEQITVFGQLVRGAAKFQVEIADAGKFDEGYEVFVEQRTYKVVGLPCIQSAGVETDHADVMLLLKDFALNNG